MVYIPANFRSSDEWTNSNDALLEKRILKICREEAEADVTMTGRSETQCRADALATARARGYAHHTLAWEFYYDYRVHLNGVISH